MAGGGDEFGGDGGELVSQVAEVAGLGWFCDQLVDHRPEVVQRCDGREGWGVLRAEGPARDGEEQCVANELEWDSAVVESAGQVSVTAAQVPGGAGSEAIEVEDPLNEEASRDG